MIKNLVFSSTLFVFLACNNSSKDPIINQFINKLNNTNSAKEFVLENYNEKNNDIKIIYIKIVSDLLLNRKTLNIKKYSKVENYQYKLINMADSNKVYIISYKKESFLIKAENNKIKYLISLRKGNEVVGWL
ncbi:hypothetical protein SAMN05421847_1564 [Halpernia humi]|uniref:Lipoprotein n=1 Tax=Halpernia humi TaxID=493375 RepID=A0A1H5XV11_9FLAO|nr:hypothetical protein [Halpernia humi]SEG15498.1 hypothetical protein SAMN05421847_1564 [Halpernia humi]